MVFNFQGVALIISILWLIILSYVLHQLYTHYNNITKGISTRTLKSLLDDLLRQVENGKLDVAKLSKRCDKIEKDGLLHIQKIGLMRFNPFKDTGGDQSFIIALLDGTNTGVLISGLYARSGTRWYAKRVVSGKSMEHDFSDEEKKVLKQIQEI